MAPLRLIGQLAFAVLRASRRAQLYRLAAFKFRLTEAGCPARRRLVGASPGISSYIYVMFCCRLAVIDRPRLPWIENEIAMGIGLAQGASHKMSAPVDSGFTRTVSAAQRRGLGKQM